MSSLKHHNPPGLHTNPAFTQAVEVPAGSSLLFIGGQNGTDTSGAVVSERIGEQTTKALDNVRLAVEAAGGDLADIAKWTILITDATRTNDGFAAFVDYWKPATPPPAITVQVVVALAHPDFLVEIDATAAIER